MIAYADPVAQAEVVRLRARVAELEAERVAFSAALGFGNNGFDTPAATLQEMVDPLQETMAAATDHYDCPVWCDNCGQWEKPRSCEPCLGTGYGGPLIQGVDNAYGWTDCEQCGGDGTDHKRYSIGEDHALTEAQERVAEIEAREQRVRWLADSFDPGDDTGYAHYAVAVDDEVILAVGLDDLRAALDGTQP